MAVDKTLHSEALYVVLNPVGGLRYLTWSELADRLPNLHQQARQPNGMYARVKAVSDEVFSDDVNDFDADDQRERDGDVPRASGPTGG